MYRTLFLTYIFGALATFGAAQQTNFNAPSTDVLDRGKVYGELDAAFKPTDSKEINKFSSIVPRIVIGAGGGVEFGVSVTGNQQPGPDSTTLVPAVKYRFYQSKDKSVSLVAGTNIYIPIRNRSYNIGTWTYLAGSRTIGKTRLTAGVYAATKNVFASNAARAGGQFGFEQTVNSKLTIAADWITGKHAAGYFTPGVIYRPKPNITTYWSYSIGNTKASSGQHFFILEIGYNFN